MMTSARLATWSLAKMFDTWLRTVLGVSDSLAAISVVVRCSASRRRIPRSRSVNSGKASAYRSGRGVDGWQLLAPT